VPDPGEMLAAKVRQGGKQQYFKRDNSGVGIIGTDLDRRGQRGQVLSLAGPAASAWGQAMQGAQWILTAPEPSCQDPWWQCFCSPHLCHALVMSVNFGQSLYVLSEAVPCPVVFLPWTLLNCVHMASLDSH
jgi:hypothetical protein